MGYLNETSIEQYSTFTASHDYTIDSFIEMQDISSDEVSLVEELQTLIKNTSKTQTQIDRQNYLIQYFQNKMPTAKLFNSFMSSLLGMQYFIKNNVEGYFTEQQTIFTNKVNQFDSRGVYSPLTQYYKFNTVKYNGETFVALQDNLAQTPNNSSDTTYWQKMAEKGDRGETGYGVGLSPKGNFIISTQYYIDDLIEYNGNLYRCIVDSVGHYPTDTNYWVLFLSGNGENYANLNTNNKTSLVLAVNEVNEKVGDTTTLTTTDKSNTVNAINENKNKIDILNTKISDYKYAVVTVDANNKPTHSTYKRKSDDTLYKDITCSNADSNGYYQTVVEKTYGTDGTTLQETKTYNLTYNADGVILTKDWTVS